MEVVGDDDPQETPDWDFWPILFQKIDPALHWLQGQEVAQADFVGGPDDDIWEVRYQ